MFILASGSPRRRELLESIDADFIVKVSSAEEFKDGFSPSELVQKNARAKAQAVAKLYEGVPVLGADTVVSLEGKTFGKPKDEADAVIMLKELSGKEHEVLTGIAWAVGEKIFSETVSTRVKFGEMSQTEIEKYVRTGEPLDKAGAYAVQGGAAVFIEGICGSYSNVVGLPLFRTARLAQEAGVDIYGSGHHGEGSAT